MTSSVLKKSPPLQNFRWAVENDTWHARVGSIPRVFAAAASDLGKPAVDAEVVRRVWGRIMPGLLEVSWQIISHSGSFRVVLTCHRVSF